MYHYKERADREWTIEAVDIYLSIKMEVSQVHSVEWSSVSGLQLPLQLHQSPFSQTFRQSQQKLHHHVGVSNYAKIKDFDFTLLR